MCTSKKKYVCALLIFHKLSLFIFSYATNFFRSLNVTDKLCFCYYEVSKLDVTMLLGFFKNLNVIGTTVLSWRIIG